MCYDVTPYVLPCGMFHVCSTNIALQATVRSGYSVPYHLKISNISQYLSFTFLQAPGPLEEVAPEGPEHEHESGDPLVEDHPFPPAVLDRVCFTMPVIFSGSS